MLLILHRLQEKEREKKEHLQLREIWVGRVNNTERLGEVSVPMS